MASAKGRATSKMATRIWRGRIWRPRSLPCASNPQRSVFTNASWRRAGTIPSWHGKPWLINWYERAITLCVTLCPLRKRKPLAEVWPHGVEAGGLGKSWVISTRSDSSLSQPPSYGLPPHGCVVRRLCREPWKKWTREGARGSVRCTQLDTAGNRGFSGASTMPGADVWRDCETSRGLDPDGWLVRRIRADTAGMKTRMRLRA